MKLSALRAPVPAGLADRILASTGPVDDYAAVDGPVGPLLVAWSRLGISLVIPGQDEVALADTVRERLDRRVRRTSVAPPGLLTALRSGRTARLEVDLRGRSDFERAVLTAARRIPTGEVRSYSWVAAAIGRPGAVRAVGTALGRNPVPVVVPCHRVVRSDGSAGDYVFGAPMKRDLLRTEGLDLERVEAFGSRGVQFLGSDTTRVFCVPSCREARRITAVHRIVFRSSSSAVAADFRPCRHCTPTP